MSVTEREAESAIDIQLASCGWRLDPRSQGRNVYKQQARTPEQNRKLGRKKPDYVLYAYEDSAKPTAIVEAKKPGESMTEALAQAINRYAKRIGAPIAIASDGWRVKTWHIVRNEPLLIDGREVDELFGPDMAMQFISDNNFSSFSKEFTIDKDDLLSKFKKANNILKNEGFSAGIERFSEFANLMFMKLQIEGQNGRRGNLGMEIAGFSWADINQKQGHALLKAIRSMLSELRTSYSKLFEQTRIRRPKNMERLIEILSSFRLSSVRADIKGLAFEHFIHSYTRGTRNDLGQYFTPRHIVRMMVHFLSPKIGETIYDPFCGTGGMLIECFRFINQHIESSDDKRRLKEETLFGRDNSDVARIAMMNMIMFGDGHSNIKQGDSYAMLEETKNKYDAVITNIPFSQQTDFYEGYPVPPVGSKNGDSIGVQHCLESLKNKETARAAIIVPIGFLYKRQLLQERQYIFKNWNVERIVELSPKCFQPYTEQQTAVLLINRKTFKGDSFPYYRVANDGYSQDGYRIPLPGENDIDKAMDDKGSMECPVDLHGESLFKRITFLIRKDEVPLGEVANVSAGAGNISPKTKIGDVYNGVHPIMMVADLARQHIDYCLTESAYKLTDKAVKAKKPYLFPENTILIPTTGKASLKNHRALLGIPAYATSTLTGIVAKESGMHPYCLFHFFLKFDVENVTYDLGYPGIAAKTLDLVPVPNYSDKEQISIIERVKEAVKLSKQLKMRHKEIIKEVSAEDAPLDEDTIMSKTGRLFEK